MPFFNRNPTTYLSNRPTNRPHQIKGRGDSSHKMRYVVGSDDPNKFVPNVNMALWEGQAFLNLNLSDLIVTNEQHSEKARGPEIKVGENRFWASPDPLIFGLEFDAFPAMQSIRLGVSMSPGMEFRLQPPITDFRIAVLRAKHNRPGLQKHDVLPEYAENSLVAHHSKRDHRIGDMNYATSIFCHLYRWYCTDETGATKICGPLEWDESKSEITIDLPVAWLASTAVGRVRVNP